MARERDVVTKKLDPAKLHSDAIRKCIKLYSPYAVHKDDFEKTTEYVVVYTPPNGAGRGEVARYKRKAKAVKLRRRLETAWAEGYYSSGVV